MSEQEKRDWITVGRFELEQIQTRLAEVEASEERYRKRLEAVEESEGRLADIVRRSLELRVFVFDNPRCVANGYYVDAKVALEKRPHP